MCEYKKIAVIMTPLMIGGLERACISFISELSKKYDVYLYLTVHCGKLLNEVPEGIHIKQLCSDKKPKQIFIENLRKGYILKALRLFYLWLKLRIEKDMQLGLMYHIRMTAITVDKKFECVIIYNALNLGLLSAGFDYFKADKWVGWIHTNRDYTNKCIKQFEKYFKGLNRIFCVSQEVRDNYLQHFPEYMYKCGVFYNLLDPQKIHLLAEADCEDHYSKEHFNILTVGRLSEEKGLDMVPQIAKQLTHSGYHIKWLILGEGPMKPEIEKEIVLLCLENVVIFQGSKTNPYPYMKNCDIFVNPSYCEGYSIASLEMRCIGKPIVVTDTPGAREQFTDGFDGLIVQATVEDLYSGIKHLLDDPKIGQRMESVQKSTPLDNNREMQKIIDVIG